MVLKKNVRFDKRGILGNIYMTCNGLKGELINYYRVDTEGRQQY